MGATTDLWPTEIEGPAGDAPVLILRRQAALLGEKTAWDLRGEVRTSTSHDNLLHSFNIVVPVLDDYTYRLFQIAHRLEQFYPIRIWSGPGEGGDLSSEEEFTAWLKEVLSSDRTRRIVSSLLAQVRT